MGNSGSSLSDLNLFSKGGVFTREQLDEYQVDLPYGDNIPIVRIVHFSLGRILLDCIKGFMP